MEGLFECIDQYESRINGARTAAAMAECARQGFYPSAHAPYGYRRQPVEFHPNVVRYRLVPAPGEAEIVREIAEEGVLRPDVCDSQVWIALAAGEYEAARRALTDYEAFLRGIAAKWAAAPEEGAEEASAHPDLALRIQCRALASLLRRRAS